MQERHRHQPLGHVAGLLGHVAGVAWVVCDVVDHERLPRVQHPSADPLTGRKTLPHKCVLPLSGHGFEDELVGLLVEQDDGGGGGGEHRPRDLDDRA